MKKFRILSLLLVVVMLAGMLTGCGDTVAKKDVEADPKAYIEEALKKSFATSPFGDILALEEKEATSVDLEIKPADEDIKSIKAAITVANKELAMLANLNMAVEDEKIDATIFVDEENFALKMEQLKEIFGKDAVGIGLKDFEKNFKESAWYKMIFIDAGLEEALKEEMGDAELDFGKIIDAYENYLKELENIAESCREFKVEESEIEYDKKSVKCYKITETMADDAADKMEKAMKKFMKDIAEAAGMTEEDLGMDEEEIAEIKKPLEELVKSSKTVYYVAKKGGAMLKITSKMNMKVDDVKYNYETWEAEEYVREIDYDVVVDFGAEPEKMFMPSFNIVVDDGESKQTMSGKSEIDTKEKTFTLAFKLDAKYDDEDMAEYMNQTIDGKFVLSEDGKYKMTMSADEEKINFGGKFKVDGSKLTFTVDMDEIEDSEIKEVKIDIDFNAKAPKAFEYEDLMKWDEAKITEFMQKIEELSGSSYDDEFDSDVDWDY